MSINLIQTHIHPSPTFFPYLSIMTQPNQCNMNPMTVPYPTHIHPPSHIPHGHPYGSPYYCPPPPPVHPPCGYYPYGGTMGGGYHYPPYPPQVTTLDAMPQPEDPFSAPNEDACTIESQHCDDLPIEEHCEIVEESHSHPDQSNHCDNDDVVSVCSSQSTMTSCTGSSYYSYASSHVHPHVPCTQTQTQPQPQPQQDTFILRVPKNRTYRVTTNGNEHGHIGPHVHINAYGQVLPNHPHLI